MKDRHFETRLQESIIDMETVLGAVADARRCKPRGHRGPLDLLASEPALQEFLKGALREIAGDMAISGCPSPVIGSVHREMAFLLAVTFAAVRQAYRDLYKDLLPGSEIDGNAAESQADRHLSPELHDGSAANRSSKKNEPKP